MPYKVWFEPIAQAGENIILLPAQKYAVNEYYVVKELQALKDGQLINDFGSLAAETEGDPAEYTDLYMPTLWLGHYRCMVLDDIEVAILHPRAVTGSTTESAVTKITKFTPQLDPTLKSTELFMFEDKPELYFQPKNTTKYALNKSRVQFFGWAYALEKMDGSPAQAARVNIEFTGIGGA